MPMPAYDFVVVGIIMLTINVVTSDVLFFSVAFLSSPYDTHRLLPETFALYLLLI
jgi:hypothetical protein